MSNTNPDRQTTSEQDVIPREYGAFIAQIQLQAIWLARTEVVNHVGPNSPRQGVFGIRGEARWTPDPEGFRAFQKYIIQLTEEDSTLLDMTVEFGLAYRSNIPMTDAIFAVFQEVNLPLNIWPYLREYLADMLGRMNWMPFTLPVFRVNTPPADAAPAAPEKPMRKRAARKASS